MNRRGDWGITIHPASVWRSSAKLTVPLPQVAVGLRFSLLTEDGWTERPILHIISEFQDMENPENPRQERLFSELMERQGNLRKEYDPQRAVFDSSEHIDHWVRENTTRSNGRSFKSWEVIADNITREYYAIDGRQHLSGTVFDNDEFR